MDREPDSLRKPDFHSFPNYKDFIFGSVDSEISDLYSEQENKAQENGSDCQFRPWDFLLLEESKTPATKTSQQELIQWQPLGKVGPPVYLTNGGQVQSFVRKPVKTVLISLVPRGAELTKFTLKYHPLPSFTGLVWPYIGPCHTVSGKPACPGPGVLSVPENLAVCGRLCSSSMTASVYPSTSFQFVTSGASVI